MQGEYDFFFVKPKYNPEMLLPKKQKEEKSKQELLTLLKGTKNILQEIDPYEEWTEEHIQNKILGYAEKNGKAFVLWPLRVALSGKEKSPSPSLIAQAIGKKETVSRVEKAITLLAGIL